MIGKLLLWLGIYCVVLLLWIYIGNMTWVIVLVTAGIIIAVSYIYSAVKTRQAHRTFTH